MNEIFGEENFIAELIWHSRQNVDSRSLTGASIDHEYVICFSKFPNNRIRGKEINKTKYTNPDNDARGPWMSSPMDGIATKDRRPNLHYTITNSATGLVYDPSPETGWRFQKSTVAQLISDNRVLWPKNPNSKPRFKRYLNELNNEFTGFSTFLDVDFTSQGTKELRTLMGTETLKFPKPISIEEELICQASNESNDIILDFFAGSGTTAHSLFELNKKDGINRKFILIQLPENNDIDTEPYKAGYNTIADVSKERIRRVIKKIETERKSKEQQLIEDKQSELDLGFKVFKLKPTNFKQWQTDLKSVEELAEQIDAFTDPVKPEAEEENMLYELLLKSGYHLTSKIVIKQIGNSQFNVINNGELVLQLSGKPNDTLAEILSINAKKVIMLDRLFENNDQLKTNTFLQFRDAGVDFRTV